MEAPQSQNAQTRQYFWLEADQHGESYIRSYDEVIVLPIDANGNVLFAVEPAPAFGSEKVLLLPGGTADPNESYEQTANRELQEELGYQAHRLERLGELRPWTKYLSVRSHLFLAQDLEPRRLPGDEAEPVGIERVPWSALDRLLAQGQLCDARAIAALALASRRLFRGAL